MSSPPSRDAREQNRRSWNHATRRHNAHKADQAAFLRDGGSTLFPEELELLGRLGARDLLHLQCNAGQDTLSLAARGARVTGVDISDEAITFATQLAHDSGIEGTFERADLYDWLDAAPGRGLSYDLVFSSYGAIGWLPDLVPWARGIASVLRPGGAFVLVEFHPLPWIFHDDWTLTYPYAGGAHVPGPGVSDYVGASGDGLTPMGRVPVDGTFTNPEVDHSWCWGLADVIQPLLDAGLRLELLREWPYRNGCPTFDGMRDLGGARFGSPPGKPELPYMYGLRVRR